MMKMMKMEENKSILDNIASLSNLTSENQSRASGAPRNSIRPGTALG